MFNSSSYICFAFASNDWILFQKSPETISPGWRLAVGCNSQISNVPGLPSDSQQKLKFFFKWISQVSKYTQRQIDDIDIDQIQIYRSIDSYRYRHGYRQMLLNPRYSMWSLIQMLPVTVDGIFLFFSGFQTSSSLTMNDPFICISCFQLAIAQIFRSLAVSL